MFIPLTFQELNELHITELPSLFQQAVKSKSKNKQIPFRQWTWRYHVFKQVNSYSVGDLLTGEDHSKQNEETITVRLEGISGRCCVGIDLLAVPARVTEYLQTLQKVSNDDTDEMVLKALIQLPNVIALFIPPKQ